MYVWVVNCLTPECCSNQFVTLADYKASVRGMPASRDAGAHPAGTSARSVDLFLRGLMGDCMKKCLPGILAMALVFSRLNAKSFG